MKETQKNRTLSWLVCRRPTGTGRSGGWYAGDPEKTFWKLAGMKKTQRNRLLKLAEIQKTQKDRTLRWMDPPPPPPKKII